MHLTPSTRTLCLVAAAALLLGTVLLNPPRTSAIGVSDQIEQPAGYDQQTTCVKKARPGTVALARWLQKSYPATGSLGMVRGCGSGGTSEHKDGRAFDWAAEHSRASTRKAAYAFIKRALATDAQGNRHALARRMGIMYFIYADRMWSSYRDFRPTPYLSSGCSSTRKCSRTLRHLNHVHISLSYAGAAAQTSWYRARNVPSLPVLFPGTKFLDPQQTAVTGLSVPATGKAVTSSFVLRAGRTYRIVATGTVTYATGKRGDAHCVSGKPWKRTARDPLAHLPLSTTRGLVVALALRWQGGCRNDHTYEVFFTPRVNQRLRLRYADAMPKGNTGTLSVYVARDDIRLSSLVRK